MSENKIDILNGFRRHSINNGRIKVLTCETYRNDRLMFSNVLKYGLEPKEIKHDKDLNVTAFNPYVNEWKAELKKYRKIIQRYTESVKFLKSEIKKNQRFMNDILN